MNNYDLTNGKIFSKNPNAAVDYDLFLGKVNHPLMKFKEKPEYYYRTKNLYIGSAKDVIEQIRCSGFGINDGYCDCCGGPTQPWISYGLCENCIKGMEEYDNKPFFLKNKTNQDEQTPWFVV